MSSATVSHVINSSRYVAPETRKNVLRAIKDLRYRRDGIARSLRRSSTGTIGIMVSDISNPFFAELVRGLEDVIYARGEQNNVILCNTDEDVEKERRYLDVLLEKRIDGLVIAPAGGNRAYLRELILKGMPVVLADRVLSGVGADAVVVNNREASREATAYLNGLGHRRVGILKAALSASSIEERFSGFREALESVGVSLSAELVVVSRSDIEAACQAARHLLDVPDPPSAVFATNNFMTLGLMRTIAERGMSCPENLSIVGFDDFPWATAFRPHLTVVSQPAYAIGREAALLLFARLGEGKDAPPVTKVLRAKLLIRESCAAVKHGSGRMGDRLVRPSTREWCSPAGAPAPQLASRGSLRPR